MPRATARVLAVAFGLVAMTSSTALDRGLIAPEGGADSMPSDRNAIRAFSSSARQLRKRTTKSSWFSSTCHTSREVLHSKPWSTFVTMGGGSRFPEAESSCEDVPFVRFHQRRDECSRRQRETGRWRGGDGGGSAKALYSQSRPSIAG